MAKRYPKRKLSTEDISRALNFDSDSDDSNDKLEKLLGEDSGSDLEFTLNRPRKSYISDSDSDSLSDSDNLNERKCKKNCKLWSKFMQILHHRSLQKHKFYKESWHDSTLISLLTYLVNKEKSCKITKNFEKNCIKFFG